MKAGAATTALPSSGNVVGNGALGHAAADEPEKVLASAFCVILFGSPLSTIAKVIRQRNSASILAAFTFAQVANCSLWAAYGLWAAKDVYVYGPNIAGLALGLAQLALRIIFPASDD
ncbi:sugar transmembrane transporter [Aureococcus anophagefferens]|nr:sugar transmembrane transporter [Aureococcus anophagefferens]